MPRETRGTPWGSAAFEREERRAAAQFLRRFDEQRGKSRTAYAPPGWYAIPHSPEGRYWNGNRWTPWRWTHDGVALDAPDGYVFAVDPAQVGILQGGAGAPRFELVATPRTAPPLADPRRVVGERRWRLRTARDIALAVLWIAVLVALVFVYLAES